MIMKTLEIDIQHALFFAGQKNYEALAPEAVDAISTIDHKSGPGADFLGWVTLPSETPQSLIDSINKTARRLRAAADYVVVVGIGGSYLGARAVISALADLFDDYYVPQPDNPKILFAGQNISEDYLASLKKLLTGKKFSIINISKSGTTTEPAIAFRVLRDLLVQQVGADKARELIVAVTDREKGALRAMADKEGYESYVIPDNVGGRFSVLTPVGLLPIACAGFNIDKLINGAKDMENTTRRPGPSNPAQTYAMMRNALYRDGKKIELLVNFDPRLHYFAEWWKQLFGESEGKDNKGIFPAAADFSTDLHSMGQWIQEGERSIFETVLSIKEPADTLRIPGNAENLDGINYLQDKRVDEVNKQAELGTCLAHVDGGVPNIRIVVHSLDEYTLGQLIYFFEKACAISGYMLGVNPFNQPGVEAYKKNMFALLGKPGFEKESEAIRARVNGK